MAYASRTGTKRNLDAMREFGEHIRKANLHMVGYHMIESDRYTLNEVCRLNAATEEAIETQIRNLETNLEGLRAFAGHVIVTDNRKRSGGDVAH